MDEHCRHSAVLSEIGSPAGVTLVMFYFVGVTVIVAMSVSALVKGLMTGHQKEKRLSSALEQEKVEGMFKMLRRLIG